MTREEERALAMACAAQDSVAIEQFGTQILDPVEKWLARRFDQEVANEATQRVRVHLLLPELSRPARISDFQGLGPLMIWVRAIAARLALQIIQSQSRMELAPNLEDAAALVDPQLGMYAHRYGPFLKAAFQEAVTHLSKRERVVLRMSVDGNSPAKIAAVFHVHVSTVSRWLSAARESLRNATLADLQHRLQLTPSAANQLMGDLAGEWQASMKRLL